MNQIFRAESQALSCVDRQETLLDRNFSCVGLIALDEVGRGSLAGPVVTGASAWCLQTKAIGAEQSWVNLVDDSKVLTEAMRENCFEAISREFKTLPSYAVGASIGESRMLAYSRLVSSE